MKRTTRSAKSSKKRDKVIRCNRKDWRKKRIYVPNPKNPMFHKIKKKSKTWEKVE